MARLGRTIQVVLYLILFAIGEYGKFHFAPVYLVGIWYAIATIAALTMAFDRSRGFWVSYALLALLALVALGLYHESALLFLSWGAIFVVGTTFVFQMASSAAPFWIKIPALLGVVSGPLLLSWISTGRQLPEEHSQLVAAALTFYVLAESVLALFLTAFRAQMWRVSSIQHFVLRLLIVGWAYGFSPALVGGSLETGSYLIPVLGVSLLLLVLFVFPKRVSAFGLWQSALTLFVLSASLGQASELLSPLLLIVVLQAIATLAPVFSRSVNGAERHLLLFEAGALGSPIWIIVILVSARRANVTPEWVTVFWLLTTAYFSARLWSQPDVGFAEGNGEVTSNRTWMRARIAFQIGVVLLIGLIVAVKHRIVL